MRAAVSLCAVLLAAPAAAQTFDVVLGGKTLGQLTYAASGDRSTVTSTLNNTPMNVFNGGFSGTSTGSAATSSFVGDSRSSRKQRLVRVEISQGRATGTTITPQDEVTELSDVARVPAGVRDPVRGIGALIGAQGCPAAMRLYDGRRVIALRPTGRTTQGGTLTCTMGYKVIAGPGHLSPLRISSAKMTLSYDTASGQSLQQIRISSGVFSLTLARRD